VSLIGSIFNFLRFNKKNWKAVVLCLFAATIFWFFNALNKNYSANINFPLTFDYDQEKFIPVKALPSTLRMNVSGLGWDLFRKSAGLKVPPLVIPLERPTEVRKIVGSTLPALFATQLEGLQINFVLTDTVYLDMDEKVKKKLSLRLDSVRRYLHHDFGVVSDISLKPDTIWIEGPMRIVQALHDPISLALPVSNIDRDYNEEIELVFQNNELVKRDPPVIEVSFDVEKLMEVNDRIELEVINIPTHVRPAIDIREINCTFRLPGSLVKKLADDSVRAVIDLRGLERGNHKVVPTIQGLPPNAYLVKVDTVRINF
jgi:YbbR domain-containing protein